VDNVQAYSCQVPQSGDIHVGNIDVVKVSQGPWRSARATVTVVDANNTLLGSVIVDGTFTGLTNGGDSGTTDVNGIAVLNSPREKNVTGDWEFCVTDLSLSGWNYNSAANVETCDNTGVPPAVGSVTGTVIDSGNAPIIGASVSSDTGQSTQTDSNGNYTLGSVPTGDRTITASASVYVSKNQNLTVVEGATATADFALDEDLGGGGVGTVKGTVMDSNGNRVFGATVETNTGQSTTTNRAGKYTLRNVPEGSRTVTATKGGSTGSDIVLVVAGQTVTLDLTLQP